MKRIAIFLLITSVTFSLKAQTYVTKIERNNVRAHVASLGLLFNNLSDNLPGFEAPKDFDLNKDPLTTIYGSTLWLGAIDAGNNQYVAAQTYRQGGNDYKAGPTDAFSDPSSLYNKLWRITKEDVDSIKTGLINKNVMNWPGNYQTLNGTEQLAPFFDRNGNGVYDPLAGENPIFPGDEALFFIYNDDTVHTESGGKVLGFEIKGFVYQYNLGNNEFLNNTVFVDYYITNKSAREYSLVNAGVWTDFDLGAYDDDRIGTDVNRNMYYAYNAKDSDGVYGLNPPAMGVTFLDIPLSSSLSYNNDFGPVGNPSTASHHYNYLNGIWKDGTSMSDKGNGYNTGGNVTKFAFSGNPCSQTGWTEANGGVVEGDRRMLGAASFNNFKPKETKKISVAYTWSRSELGGSIPSLCKLFSQVDSLKKWANNQPPLSIQNTNKLNVNVYPNPASQKVTIDVGAITGKVNIELYDITGKLITATTEKTIDVANLSKGLYIIKGKAGESHFTKKLHVE